ncbi:MAG: hypothetical protein IJS09_05020 [Treponema sp.]|nr:hypothetical protein [Treponema sp.]
MKNLKCLGAIFAVALAFGFVSCSSDAETKYEIKYNKIYRKECRKSLR